MPLYTYRCSVGDHTIDHLHRLRDGERPPFIACNEHGCMAHYQIAAPAIGTVAGSSNPVRPSMDWSDEERAAKQAPPPLAMFDYLCQHPDCGTKFEALNDFTEGEKPDTPRPCPRCGDPSPRAVSFPHEDGTMKMYPYFDRGLGMTLTSPAHRRQVCAERGVIPVDGDYDNTRLYNERMKPYREAEAYCAKLRDEMKNSPTWAKYREHADRQNGGKPVDDYLSTQARPIQ